LLADKNGINIQQAYLFAPSEIKTWNHRVRVVQDYVLLGRSG